MLILLRIFAASFKLSKKIWSSFSLTAFSRAKKYNLTLVTNDSKLYDSAKDEEIEVLKSSEFQE